MSPEKKASMKLSTKYILTVVGVGLTILITVVTATASITTKYNAIKAEFVKVENDFKINNTDHTAIIASLTAEVKRATAADTELKEDVKDVSDIQIQVVTNQGIILKAIESQ